MILSKTNTETLLYYFESVGDLVTWIDKTPQTKLGKKYSSSTLTGQSRAEFTGTESFEEAQQLLREGDSKLARMINDTKRDIKAKTHGGNTKSNMIVRSAQGFLPDVGAYMTGHPINMFNIKQGIKPISKVISVVYNCGVGFLTTTNQMISAAVKVSEAIATLEARGYRVNIYVGKKSYRCPKRRTSKAEQIGTLVKIKDAGKPLDPLRVSYPLAHPSFFRRHLFAVAERAKWKLPDTYGSSVSFEKSDLTPTIGRHIQLSAMEIIYNEGANSIESIIRQIEEAARKA